MTEVGFYLHEDEWGMISIMPAENLSHSRATAAEAREFGEKHFNGSGWADIYVLPGEPYPISARRIPLSELREMFASLLNPVGHVETGYSSHREAVTGAFALVGEPYGAIYGRHREGVITGLYVSRFAGEQVEGTEQFIKRVVTLGERYSLILADWWRHRIIDLRDEAAVTRYILGDDE